MLRKTENKGFYVVCVFTWKRYSKLNKSYLAHIRLEMNENKS
jgi:hypothetical protein